MTSEPQHHDQLDAGGLDELDVNECWTLLATQPVGRVAVIVNQYPVVMPVNFAVIDQSVIFRSAPGDKLNRIHGTKVSFEVDHIDPVHHTGWSVLIKGIAHGLNVGADHDLAERSLAAGAAPWTPGERKYIVRIVPDEVTGRRVRPAEFPPSSDIRAYL